MNDHPSEQAMNNLYDFLNRVLLKTNTNTVIDPTDSQSTDVIPSIMSLKQAASFLGISEPTLKRRIRDKKIKAYKDGGCWKFKREWVWEYQNELLKKSGLNNAGSNKSQMSTKNIHPIKEMRIVSQIVVDRAGNKIGDDPAKFPSITIKCKELIAFLETGKEYIVVVPDNTD